LISAQLPGKNLRIGIPRALGGAGKIDRGGRNTKLEGVVQRGAVYSPTDRTGIPLVGTGQARLSET